MQTPEMELLQLPEELLLRIMLELEPPEVSKMSQTCKLFAGLVAEGYLWQLLSERRFGKNKAHEYKALVDADLSLDSSEADEQLKLAAWSEVYRDLSELWLPSSEMDIAHMDGHYWRLVTLPESRSEKVAFLNAVCWFDAAGTIGSVPTGRTYRVVFRIALGFNAPVGALDGMLMRARVLPDHSHINEENGTSELPDPASGLPETSLRWTPHFIQRLKSPAPRSRLYGQEQIVPVWRTVALPPLHVPREAPDGSLRRYAPIRVEMVSHTGYWKSNLWIDGVEIVPVGGPSEREAERSLVVSSSSSSLASEAAEGESSSSGSSSAPSSSAGSPSRPPGTLPDDVDTTGGWLGRGMRFVRTFFE